MKLLVGELLTHCALGVVCLKEPGIFCIISHEHIYMINTIHCRRHISTMGFPILIRWHHHDIEPGPCWWHKKPSISRCGNGPIFTLGGHGLSSWCEFNPLAPMKSECCFQNLIFNLVFLISGLAPVRRQAITWIHDSLVSWHRSIYASLSLNALKGCSFRNLHQRQQHRHANSSHLLSTTSCKYQNELAIWIERQLRLSYG